MNKLLLAALLGILPVSSFAAQQQLQTRANTTSPSVDTNFTRQQAMNTDLYTNKADKSTLTSKSAFFAAFGWDTGVSDYVSLTNKPTIPSALADLSTDSTHRVVTDAEKTTWNGKANTSAFASSAAFQTAFGWSPLGTFDTTADQTITGDWSFSAGIEASNIKLNLGSLSDLTIGNAQMVDDTKGNGDANFLWSADKTFDQLATKQATLVSGTNIKTINGSSLLGAGDLTISGGTGTSGYVELSAEPYSDTACTTGQYGYYGSTAYLCTGGFWTSKWTLTTHSNASPVAVCTYSDDYLYSAGTLAQRTTLYDTDQGVGGVWTQTTTGSDPKITNTLYSKIGSPTNFIARIGTTPDLTSTYMASVLFDVTADAGELLTVTFPGVVLPPGTYYWRITGASGGSYVNRLSFAEDSTASGGNWYETISGGMNPGAEPTVSHYGTVSTCK